VKKEEAEYVVLVDVYDNELGTMEKMQAHVEGKLHRAVSVFIFNSRKELLLQRRADGKYHSAGLWTNTCCGHPRPGEQHALAAARRLYEELGLSCELIWKLSFTYQANLDNNLSEHEFDHVYIGFTDQWPQLNPQEASEWKYATISEIQELLDTRPGQFTAWFKIVFNQIKQLAESSFTF
jgi:isopentenyl-diphosphate Delta-isomerase